MLGAPPIGAWRPVESVRPHATTSVEPRASDLTCQRAGPRGPMAHCTPRPGHGPAPSWAGRPTGAAARAGRATCGSNGRRHRSPLPDTGGAPPPKIHGMPRPRARAVALTALLVASLSGNVMQCRDARRPEPEDGARVEPDASRVPGPALEPAPAGRPVERPASAPVASGPSNTRRWVEETAAKSPGDRHAHVERLLSRWRALPPEELRGIQRELLSTPWTAAEWSVVAEVFLAYVFPPDPANEELLNGLAGEEDPNRRLAVLVANRPHDGVRPSLWDAEMARLLKAPPTEHARAVLEVASDAGLSQETRAALAQVIAHGSDFRLQQRAAAVLSRTSGLDAPEVLGAWNSASPPVRDHLAEMFVNSSPAIPSERRDPALAALTRIYEGTRSAQVRRALVVSAFRRLDLLSVTGTGGTESALWALAAREPDPELLRELGLLASAIHGGDVAGAEAVLRRLAS